MLERGVVPPAGCAGREEQDVDLRAEVCFEDSRAVALDRVGLDRRSPQKPKDSGEAVWEPLPAREKCRFRGSRARNAQ